MNNPFNAPVYFKKSTDSTMNDARGLLNTDIPHGTVCVAGTQSAGRGRMPGRQWEDDGQSALLFTLILQRTKVPSGLPLTQLLALALHRYLERAHSLISTIKWPNDLLVNNKKIAGILVETEKDYYLAGVGLNLSQRYFPASLRRPAESLVLALEQQEIATKYDISVESELALLLVEIRNILNNAPSVESFNSCLDGLNCPAVVHLGDPSRQMRLEGTITGVADDGALIIKTADGKLHLVHSGELDFS